MKYSFIFICDTPSFLTPIYIDFQNLQIKQGTHKIQKHATISNDEWLPQALNP